MDVVNSLRPDSILRETDDLVAETPSENVHQKFALPSQGCMICITPINHVPNLDMALDNDHDTGTSPITTNCSPPANHAILLLNDAFQLAIQENNIAAITAINKLYNQTLNPTWTFSFMTTSTSAPPGRSP